MAQLQELANILLSAGAAQDAAGDGVIFLYTANSTLISKRWNGSDFRDEELLAKPVRNHSPATYIQTDDTRRVVCFSEDSTTISFKYDEDEDEWCQDEEFPEHAVHSESGLAAVADDSGEVLMIFQTPSGSLVIVDGSDPPFPIPVNAAAGTPISMGTTSGVAVFYISADDHNVHCVTSLEDGTWQDRVVVNYPLEKQVKRMCLFPNADKDNNLLPYILTEDNDVIVVAEDLTVDGGNVLGKIDNYGSFKASTTTECGFYVMALWSIHVHVAIKVAVFGWNVLAGRRRKHRHVGACW